MKFILIFLIFIDLIQEIEDVIEEEVRVQEMIDLDQDPEAIQIEKKKMKMEINK